jgi:hypothetical protein
MATQTPAASSQRPARIQPALTHAAIAGEAEAIWRDEGCPSGLDAQIWLEAERRLYGAARLGWGGAGMLAPASATPRMDMNSGTMMEELEDLFPAPTGKETTSL